MDHVNTIKALRNAIKPWRLANESIAFVPTMGNLHEGHLKLVEVAQSKADKVIVSIFVNPTQFGPGEDYANYPRTEDEDRKKLQAVGADLLFTPSVSEVYRPGTSTTVSVTKLAKLYCGAFRPGHFNGVATIVCKLFNMVQPDFAIFGQKDYQQLTIINAMVRDLNMPIEIIGVPTVRTPEGLAMSSRNNYLSPKEKEIAPMLYVSLSVARELISEGNHAYAQIERQALEFLRQEGFQPEYFNVCRASDLQKATAEDVDLVILAAAKLGKTRLIDNIHFNLQSSAIANESMW